MWKYSETQMAKLADPKTRQAVLRSAKRLLFANVLLGLFCAAYFFALINLYEPLRALPFLFLALFLLINAVRVARIIDLGDLLNALDKKSVIREQLYGLGTIVRYMANSKNTEPEIQSQAQVFFQKFFAELEGQTGQREVGVAQE